MAELLSRSGTVNVLPGESELNWSWPDYLINLYIGRRGNTFSIRQGTETRMFKGLKIEEIESVPNGNSAGSSAAADEPILFPLQGDPMLPAGRRFTFSLRPLPCAPDFGA